MHAKIICALASLLATGCVTGHPTSKPERNFNAGSLTVGLTSDGHRIIDSVPKESAMDRFEMIDTQGRIISYVAFSDTNTGALLFVNRKLYGTLSHHDAQAFYICRGHATASGNHWGQEASDWSASLLANSKPATEVTLDFSGKSTGQSITEVAESPFLKRLKSLMGLGTNPFGIFNSLSTAKSDLETNRQFDNEQKELNLIQPGMSESRLAGIMKPEDVSFVGGGIVMAYPGHIVEYYVSGGAIKVIQQPSMYYLAKNHAALFYAPDTRWALCTPAHWKDALPDTPAIPTEQN